MNRSDRQGMTGYTQCGFCGYRHNSWRKRAKCMARTLRRHYGKRQMAQRKRWRR